MIALPEAGARRAARRCVDWRHAAELLARGLTVAAAARQLDCSFGQLSRKRNHDPIFRRWIEELQQSIAAHDDNPIGDLRQALHKAIEAEVRNGNVRVIIWLADRLKLITPPSERTPDQELRSILGGLGPDELQEFESLRDPS